MEWLTLIGYFITKLDTEQNIHEKDAGRSAEFVHLLTINDGWTQAWNKLKGYVKRSNCLGCDQV